ncbi:hypothetical protein PPERSA_00612 [Pseudocohnilembus persalinus]|uniref:Uncharacterized protein n=1 Tax=Pseudocohnilembus persalinus TaxID=266149 RepID=A0A0V0QSP1_PSEPJ|nr:hypothetical protein PPERSA_00612 [Pseudocohnilembus persalinus]|eukprot:KRX05311.1 hypothetical protein PPERSA_00612 [Pseudocohnilembus persalinus]
MIYALLKHQNVLKEKQEEEKKEEEIMKNMNSKEKKAYKRDKEKAQAKKMKEVEEKKKKDPFYEQRQKLDLDGVEYLEKLTEPLEEANHFAEKIINVDITQPRLADSAYSALIDLQIARMQNLVNEKSIEGEVLESVQEEIKNLSSGKDIEALNSEFLKTIENKIESALIREKISLELEQIDSDKFAENLEKIALENISSLSLERIKIKCLKKQ